MGVQIIIREKDMLRAGAKKVVKTWEESIVLWDEDTQCDVYTGDYEIKTSTSWQIPGFDLPWGSYMKDDFMCDWKSRDPDSNWALLGPWIEKNKIPHEFV